MASRERLPSFADFLPSPVHDALKEAHALLRERYGARLRQVVLYGSQVRGDAHDESDVDVLVVLDDPVRRYDEVKRLANVSMEMFNQFGYWISFKVVSATDFEDPDYPLMINVRREGIAL